MKPVAELKAASHYRPNVQVCQLLLPGSDRPNLFQDIFLWQKYPQMQKLKKHMRNHLEAVEDTFEKGH